MSITEYGDMSPRTAGYITKKLLTYATGNTTGGFGAPAKEPEGPDNDSLYLCGNSQCDGHRPSATDPLAQRPCPYREPHIKTDQLSRCRDYDPRNIEEPYVIRIIIDQDKALAELALTPREESIKRILKQAEKLNW